MNRKLVLILVPFIVAASLVGIWALSQPDKPRANRVATTNEPEETPESKRPPDNREPERTPDTPLAPPDPVRKFQPLPPLDPTKPARRTIVRGRVLDALERPVEGAKVTFQGTGELARFRGMGFTDTLGAYEFVAWERSAMRPSREETGGFCTAELPDKSLVAGEVIRFPHGPLADMGTLAIKGLGEIRGVARDNNGRLAEGVRIVLRSTTPVDAVDLNGPGQEFVDRRKRNITREVYCNLRGEFTATGMPEGVYVASVDSTYFGILGASPEIKVSAGQPSFTQLELNGNNAIRGLVLDGQGAPVPNMVVELVQVGRVKDERGREVDTSGEGIRNVRRGDRGVARDAPERRSRRTVCTTDGSGRFGFAGLLDTTYRLTAGRGDLAVSMDEVRINQADVRLALPLKGAISGAVRDSETGMPVYEFDVRWSTGQVPEKLEPASPFERADRDRKYPWHDNGLYRYPNPTPGSGILRVAAPGYAPRSVILRDIAEGESRSAVDMLLDPLCDVEFEIRQGERALPLEIVEVQWARTNQNAYETSSDSFGLCRVGGMTPGEYVIFVRLPDNRKLRGVLVVPARAKARLAVELSVP